MYLKDNKQNIFYFKYTYKTYTKTFIYKFIYKNILSQHKCIVSFLHNWKNRSGYWQKLRLVNIKVQKKLAFEIITATDTGSNRYSETLTQKGGFQRGLRDGAVS